MADATLGMGGHTELFLQENPNLTIFACDQDPFAREIAEERLKKWRENITIFPENFEYFPKRLSEKGIYADGILFDIGVSSLHFDDAMRGFSCKNDGPLDMRMNPSQDFTAETVVNYFSEEEISRILWEFGEERFARRIAKAIVQRRKQSLFSSTTDLANCIALAKPKLKEYGGGHPSAQSFQAIRIVVNRELEVLQTALSGALQCLAPGGRLAVIAFHSLEDRIVKHVFSEHSLHQKCQKYPSSASVSAQKTISQEKFRVITKKPVTPSVQEIFANPRARSARLRVIERELY